MFNPEKDNHKMIIFNSGQHAAEYLELVGLRIDGHYVEPAEPGDNFARYGDVVLNVGYLNGEVLFLQNENEPGVAEYHKLILDGERRHEFVARFS